MPGPLHDIATEFFAIPVLAGRIFIRHFPQIVTLVCLGLAGRQAVIWLSVWASSSSPVLAMLTMPLAPACVMISLIYCMWIVLPSLTAVRNDISFDDETTGFDLIKTRWVSVGALLIPFLSAYVSHGMLRDDFVTFRHVTTTEEVVNQGMGADFSRSYIASGTVWITFIVITMALRKVVGFTAAKRPQNRVIPFFVGYLEVLWMATGSAYLSTQVQRWVEDRRSIAPTLQVIRDASNTLDTDSLSFATRTAAWISTELPHFLRFVSVPISWLTLTVIVYGSLAASHQILNSNDKNVSRGFFSNSRGLSSLFDPFKTTWKGLRTLAQTGLISLSGFCLLFTLADVVQIGIIHCGRALAGPQNDSSPEFIASYILICANAAYLVVMICLLAAAVERFSRNRSYFSLAPATT